jgi:hypothetical protein
MSMFAAGPAGSGPTGVESANAEPAQSMAIASVVASIDFI